MVGNLIIQLFLTSPKKNANKPHVHVVSEKTYKRHLTRTLKWYKRKNVTVIGRNRTYRQPFSCLAEDVKYSVQKNVIAIVTIIEKARTKHNVGEKNIV